MEQPSKNNQFTAQDIERYHTGKMSNVEMHALERAALEDPFLADALEGYSFTPTPAEDLAKLEIRLREKLEGKKSRPLFFLQNRWLRAAAILVFVAGTGWFVYRTLSTEKKNLAFEQQSTKAAQKESVSDSVSPSVSMDRKTEPSLPVQKGKAEERSSGVRTIKPKYHSKDMQSQTDEVAIAPNVNATNANAEKKFTEPSRNNASGQTPTLQSREAEGYAAINQANKERNAAPNNRAKNEVDVAQNRDQALSGRAAGATKNDTVRNFNVTMKPIAMPPAQEMVLDRSKRKVSDSDRLSHVVVETLEPAEGLASFDDYIAANIKPPDELKFKSVPGEVQLSFEVDEGGMPVNITVVKSLCAKCDEEAVRLLKEGPKWKQKKNKKGKVTIRF
jgi:hypothetical protein